jgi:hypothetical protein
VKTPVCCWILLAISASCSSASAQTTQFVREKITVRVHGTYCTLDASYYFRNHGASVAQCPIFYPLLNTKTLPFPDSLFAAEDTSTTPLALNRTKDGVSFSIRIPPDETKCVRVWYRQRTPVKRFEYILTTTQLWGKPLELAEFIIIVPDSLQLTFKSIPVDKIVKHGSETEYHSVQRNFMPTANLVIEWKRRKP